VTTIGDDDQFLLLACDGLFDVFSPEEVVVFVREQMLKHADAQRCCQVRALVICLSAAVGTGLQL
jgi:serine/threonine protein phosphatase PrpC